PVREWHLQPLLQNREAPIQERSGGVRLRSLAETQGSGRLEHTARFIAVLRGPGLVPAQFFLSAKAAQACVPVFWRDKLFFARLVERNKTRRARWRIHAI